MDKFKELKEAINALKMGKIIVVTDDENRENEGDLICSAELATSEMINFMATYARGLICIPLSEEYTEKLNFYQMVEKNSDEHGTAFTVSVDYKTTTTGISTEERALTARKICDNDAKPEDFKRPGHMFPLKAKKGGVLVREGHTEATVDLMRLAGLKPVGICCEIMNEDGSMMRYNALKRFAQRHKMPFITIKELIDYRKENAL